MLWVSWWWHGSHAVGRGRDGCKFVEINFVTWSRKTSGNVWSKQWQQCRITTLMLHLLGTSKKQNLVTDKMDHTVRTPHKFGCLWGFHRNGIQNCPLIWPQSKYFHTLFHKLILSIIVLRVFSKQVRQHEFWKISRSWDLLRGSVLNSIFQETAFENSRSILYYFHRRPQNERSKIMFPENIRAAQ